MSSRVLILGGLAAVAALSLGWSAIAAVGGDDDERSGERCSIPVPPPPDGARGDVRFHVAPAPEGAEEEGRRSRPLPFPPIGPPGSEHGDLTWGELHMQRDGEDVVVRIDRGEIASVDDESITVAENDGNDVEIPVDEDTEIHAGPFKGEVSLDGLEHGDEVIVNREGGGAADAIGVLPEAPFARPGREGG